MRIIPAISSIVSRSFESAARADMHRLHGELIDQLAKNREGGDGDEQSIPSANSARPILPPNLGSARFRHIQSRQHRQLRWPVAASSDEPGYESAILQELTVEHREEAQRPFTYLVPQPASDDLPGDSASLGGQTSSSFTSLPGGSHEAILQRARFMGLMARLQAGDSQQASQPVPAA